MIQFVHSSNVLFLLLELIAADMFSHIGYDLSQEETFNRLAIKDEYMFLTDFLTFLHPDQSN